MRVIVVGAGIGGLAVAVGLRQAGVDVQILERAERVRAHGSGLSLFRNGFRALDAIGIGEQVRATAGTAVAVHQSGTRSRDGSWLTRMGPASTNDVRVIDRADLHRILLASVAPDSIRTGAVVASVTATSVVLDTGEHLFADVIVGADGLRSAVRTSAFDDPGVRDSGYGAWRAITTRPVATDTAGESVGRGERFGIAPLADGRVYWFACVSTPPGSSPAGDAAMEEVRRRFGHWHQPIEEILDATDPASVSYLPIEELAAPLASFVSGRRVLIGDAAHAMTPNLGQGANLAIEDAATLATLLIAAAKHNNELPAVLARYDALRRRRTQRIARQARVLGAVMQASHPVTATLRDLAMRSVPARAVDSRVRAVTSWSPPTA
ncbi:putative monooxygenase [Gordonia polyisoprenivorans VH2]|uniref:Putative monooxygenase n=1 Tax=Gordonia polyisoprenivorans (strain DSM 44266 / VH2) TaxID=1112204 RepID=H6MR69_GORPV|nr:FAD-dependent monooxygenase [Gordonia polyisoprenivorans]AFA74973.1 putative monooxygenase [Gordonia polyisoprenivorans VH2]